MKIEKITNSQRYYKDCLASGSRRDLTFFEIFISLTKRKPVQPPKKPNFNLWR